MIYTNGRLVLVHAPLHMCMCRHRPSSHRPFDNNTAHTGAAHAHFRSCNQCHGYLFSCILFRGRIGACQYRCGYNTPLSNPLTFTERRKVISIWLLTVRRIQLVHRWHWNMQAPEQTADSKTACEPDWLVTDWIIIRLSDALYCILAMCIAMCMILYMAYIFMSISGIAGELCVYFQLCCTMWFMFICMLILQE
jgi:hypothetical protein